MPVMNEAYLFVFTDIASTEGFIIAVLLLGAWLYFSKRTREAITFLFSAAGMMVSVQALKEWLRVPRPEAALIDTIGYAFPSGHSAGAFFLALSACVLATGSSRPYVCVLALVAALLIGLSRIQLGVHTPLQVAAGFVIGVAWVSVWTLLKRSRK